MVIHDRRPHPGVIFHSGHGTDYTSEEFDRCCNTNNITRSLCRTGICYDNAVSDSFVATYKKELVHTRPRPDLRTLRTETVRLDRELRQHRPMTLHLRYLTPEEYELGYRKNQRVVS